MNLNKAKKEIAGLMLNKSMNTLQKYNSKQKISFNNLLLKATKGLSLIGFVKKGVGESVTAYVDDDD